MVRGRKYCKRSVKNTRAGTVQVWGVSETTHICAFDVFIETNGRNLWVTFKSNRIRRMKGFKMRISLKD